MPVEDLRAQLLRGQRAKTALVDRDEEYAYNRDMRDSAQPQINKYGTVSPLSILANTVRKSRGRKGIREGAQARTDAREGVNSAALALPMYQAKLAADKVTQDQTNFETTTGLTVAAAAAKQAQLDLENERAETARKLVATKYATTQGEKQTALALEASRYGEGRDALTTAPTAYIRPDGSRVNLSRTEAGDWVDDERNKVTDITGWKEVPKATITSDGSTYKDKAANKRAEDAINALGTADRVVGLYKNLSPESIDNMGSNKTLILKTLSKATGKDVHQLIKNNFHGDPQVSQYLTALAQMSAEERHAMFGGALTTYEGMEAGEFLSFVFNMKPEEQQRRIRNSVAKNKLALTVGDQVHGGGNTNFMDAFGRMEFKNLDFDPQEPQKGSVNAVDVEQARLDEVTAIDARMAQLQAELDALNAEDTPQP